MKVLYVCHRFPFPPKRGGKIRPFNMIRHLHDQGHQITVASLARSPEEAAEGEGLQAHCHEFLMERVSAPWQNLRMLTRLPSLEPSSMGYFYSPALARRIREAVAREAFDLIFVHCSSVAQYVAEIQGIPKILDFGDMDSQKWLTYAQTRRFPLSSGYWLEGTKLEREEKRLASKFDFCTCTTRAELDSLREYNTGVPTDWFPNGVDAEFFSPGHAQHDENTVCFVGRMDYYPNQQAMFGFCRDVWPMLRERNPIIQLLIVGADPSVEVKALGRLEGVTVTGSVPDVRPFVQQAALTVAPLAIARGTQNKILESMAMGVPVVSSSLAAGGVDAVDGEHILTADTPAQYCEAIMSILENPALRAHLAKAARERMLSNHSWPSSMKRLDEIIARALQLPKQGSSPPSLEMTG